MQDALHIGLFDVQFLSDCRRIKSSVPSSADVNAELRLLETKTFTNGVVLLHYERYWR